MLWEIQITNNSKNQLFLNGEIFEGAKQDRMLNSIVEPNSELMADVSCVERNRCL